MRGTGQSSNQRPAFQNVVTNGSQRPAGLDELVPRLRYGLCKNVGSLYSCKDVTMIVVDLALAGLIFLSGPLSQQVTVDRIQGAIVPHVMQRSPRDTYIAFTIRDYCE